MSHFVALNRNIYFFFSKISIFCLRFNNLTYRFHNCRGNTNLRGYLFQCHRLFFGNWKWVNSTTEIRVLSSSNLEGKRFGGCEDEDFWLVVWMAAGLESSAKESKKYIKIASFNVFTLFENHPKCLILNSLILAFSTNFCPIKTDMSGNTVWPQASVFQKTRQNGQLLAFLIYFCLLKM